jgi:phosphatidylserine/phosphatidylglycerophosphate/cardiolipin synthase-like enzyme
VKHVPTRRTPRELELVVTVPEMIGVEITHEFGLRTTLGVLTELLACANRHVIIGAPFIQGSRGLLAEPLATALRGALERGVHVDIVSTSASLAGLRLLNLRRAAGSQLRTYQPRGNAEDARSLGSHAKFCMADGRLAYVGSANVTHMGIGGHLEIGVLLSGPAARQLWRLVTKLFEIGYLVEVPSGTKH